MSGRILIVDDEPQIRRVLRTALTGRGYEVHDAKTWFSSTSTCPELAGWK